MDDDLIIWMPLKENIPTLPQYAGHGGLGKWLEVKCPICGTECWITESMIIKKSSKIACSNCALKGEGVLVKDFIGGI